MRKIIEIIFYVISGIFLYSAILFSFLEAEYFIVTLIFLCVLCLFAIIFFFIGQKFSISSDWRRSLGIVTLSSTCFAFFAVITLVSLFNSEDFYKFMSRSASNIFTNYIQGLLITTSFLIVGWFLISNIKAEQSCVEDGEDHAAPNT